MHELENVVRVQLEKQVRAGEELAEMKRKLEDEKSLLKEQVTSRTFLSGLSRLGW